MQNANSIIDPKNRVPVDGRGTVDELCSRYGPGAPPRDGFARIAILYTPTLPNGSRFELVRWEPPCDLWPADQLADTEHPPPPDTEPGPNYLECSHCEELFLDDADAVSRFSWYGAPICSPCYRWASSLSPKAKENPK